MAKKLRKINRTGGDSIEWVSFRDAVVEIMEERGMTNTELARLSGVSRTSIINCVSGKVAISIEAAEKIMQALDMRFVQVAHVEKTKK